MDSTKIEHYVVTHTSSRRYAHCLSTAKETQELLRLYAPSFSDDEGAYITGLWHDVAREWSDIELFQYCLKHAVTMEDEEYLHPMLLHGPVAAHLLSFRYAQVPDIWKTAIRWHTIGSKTMGVLGAALFVADYMEPLRSHIQPEERTSLLQSETLEQLCACVVQRHLSHLEKRGKASALSTRELATFLGSGGVFT